MVRSANELRWRGQPGHYEVYYLTLTDPASGVGVWIRYTMLAAVGNREPTCALWLAAMDPRPGARPALARRETFAISELDAARRPFELKVAGSTLTDGAMRGGFGEVAWDLTWAEAPRPLKPVAPWLHSVGVAHTAFVLPHPELRIDGWVSIGEDRLELSQAPGGQAHLWGSKHATSWAWARCNDFRTGVGEPAPGVMFDGVSAVVSRFGRRWRPSTPVVGRVEDRGFDSTSPLRILTNGSRFGPEGWRFEALDARHRLVGEVRPTRGQIVGVTYEDPDGEKAYCYNSETASVHLQVYERSRRTMGWRTLGTFLAAGRCHFEYGQRTPLPGVELLVK